jgi:hypothetical protein
VAEAGQILRETGSVLVVDWPSKDVPETLTRAGYTVLVKGGPNRTTTGPMRSGTGRWCPAAPARPR